MAVASRALPVEGEVDHGEPDDEGNGFRDLKIDELSADVGGEPDLRGEV